MLSTDRRRACGKERGSWKIRWISNKKCTSCSYVYTILVKVYAPQSRVVSISRKHGRRLNLVKILLLASLIRQKKHHQTNWEENGNKTIPAGRMNRHLRFFLFFCCPYLSTFVRTLNSFEYLLFLRNISVCSFHLIWCALSCRGRQRFKRTILRRNCQWTRPFCD